MAEENTILHYKKSLLSEEKYNLALEGARADIAHVGGCQRRGGDARTRERHKKEKPTNVANTRFLTNRK